MSTDGDLFSFDFTTPKSTLKKPNTVAPPPPNIPPKSSNISPVPEKEPDDTISITSAHGVSVEGRAKPNTPPTESKIPPTPGLTPSTAPSDVQKSARQTDRPGPPEVRLQGVTLDLKRNSSLSLPASDPLPEKDVMLPTMTTTRTLPESKNTDEITGTSISPMFASFSFHSHDCSNLSNISPHIIGFPSGFPPHSTDVFLNCTTITTTDILSPDPSHDKPNLFCPIADHEPTTAPRTEAPAEVVKPFDDPEVMVIEVEDLDSDDQENDDTSSDSENQDSSASDESRPRKGREQRRDTVNSQPKGIRGDGETGHSVGGNMGEECQEIEIEDWEMDGKKRSKPKKTATTKNIKNKGREKVPKTKPGNKSTVLSLSPVSSSTRSKKRKLDQDEDHSPAAEKKQKSDNVSTDDEEGHDQATTPDKSGSPAEQLIALERVLQKKSVAELRGACKKHKVKQSGKKSELIKRICDAIQDEKDEGDHQGI